MEKQLKMLLFLRFFEEILGALKRVYMILYLSTMPSVSLKNLKKVVKKVLTLPCPRGIIYKSPGYSDKHKQQSCEQTQQSEP